MNLLFRKPLDLSPEQLQVYLHDEKQESYYVTLAVLVLGAVAGAKWPAFGALYTTFGGFVLAAMGMLFGVNVFHKSLNNKAAATLSEETGTGDDDETPRPSRT